MAINPEADLAHWLQIFGPGRYEGHHEETKLEKIEEIIQHEEQIDPQVRLFYQHLTTQGQFLTNSGSKEVKIPKLYLNWVSEL